MPTITQRWQTVEQISSSPPLTEPVQGEWTAEGGAASLADGLGGGGGKYILSNELVEAQGDTATPLLLLSNPDRRVPLFANTTEISDTIRARLETGFGAITLGSGVVQPQNCRSWSAADGQTWDSAGTGTANGIRSLVATTITSTTESVITASTWQANGIRDTFGYGAGNQPPGNASRLNPEGAIMLRIGASLNSDSDRLRLRDASRVITFTAPPAPGAFALVAPADGAGDIPLTPTLTWGASSLAVRYRVVISPSANLSSPVIDATLAAITRESQTPEASYTVPVGALAHGTTYHWRAYAINYAGGDSTLPQETAASGIFSFTTSPPPAQGAGRARARTRDGWWGVLSPGRLRLRYAPETPANRPF